MNNVAAKCITLFLRRWGLKGQNLTALIDQTNHMLDSESVTQNFLSEDFGRVLQAQALGILQEERISRRSYVSTAPSLCFNVPCSTTRLRPKPGPISPLLP